MYCIGSFLSAKEILKSQFVRGNINVIHDDSIYSNQ